MWAGFTGLETSLGFSLESIIVLITFIGGFLFYAINFKVGLIIHFLLFALEFVWFYAVEWNYIPALSLCLGCLVLLAITLYATLQSSKSPYGSLI